MRPDIETLRPILASGILAPSADNRLHLRFRVLDESVELIATDAASWVEQPHRRGLALLAYGAVVENLALRSAASGWALMPHWFPCDPRGDCIARLQWVRQAGRDRDFTDPVDPLNRAIERRHTNRRFYRREAVPANTLAALTDAAAQAPGVRLLWLDEPTRRRQALQAIRLAETERFRRRELHAELFAAVRFDRGWRGSVDEGLPPAALEVEPAMRLPFAWLRHPALMRAFNRLGAHHMLGWRAGYLPCALAPHLGLIVAQGPTPDLEAVQAGRGLQRAWLAATAHGLAMQPMAAATVLMRQRPGAGWVSAGVRSRLESLLEGLCDTGVGRPYLLFRIGRAAAPHAVTGRLPLEHHLGT